MAIFIIYLLQSMFLIAGIFPYQVYCSPSRISAVASSLYMLYCRCQRSREILSKGVASLKLWWTQTFNLFKSNRYIFARPLVTFIHKCPGVTWPYIAQILFTTRHLIMLESVRSCLKQNSCKIHINTKTTSDYIVTTEL